MPDERANLHAQVSRRRADVFRAALWIAAAIVVCIAGLWFTRAVQDAREAARRTQCLGCLFHIVLAMHNYHDTYGRLPPAYIADADGRPMHSWRVLLLPFLDGQDIYNDYDFSEPWNSPHNRRLEHRINHRLFFCPSGPHHDASVLTDFVVISGPGTAFPGADSVSFDDISDGPENTIFLVEIANSDIHWMEPRDLDVREMSFVVDNPDQPSISSAHPAGPGVVFGDGRYYRLIKSVRPEILQALTTIAGDEGVTRETLFQESDAFSRQRAE